MSNTPQGRKTTTTIKKHIPARNWKASKLGIYRLEIWLQALVALPGTWVHFLALSWLLQPSDFSLGYPVPSSGLCEH